jgi:hypothetical protein
MMGIEVPYPVGNVFKAKTLFDFFEKTNRYYAVFILDLFIYPCFRALSFIQKKSVRMGFAFFIGIAGGGLIQHYMRAAIVGANHPQFHIHPLQQVLHAAPYWTSLSFLIALSLWYERKTQETARAPFVPFLLRGGCYFVAAAALFLFVRDYDFQVIHVSERVRLLFSLFRM